MRLNLRVALPVVVGIGALVTVAAANGVGVQPAAAARAQASSGLARAVLQTAAGDEVGRATFTDQNGQLVVSVDASGLAPGFHGFHVHSVGRCDAPDFTSAGSHFNTAGAMPGMQGHDGDLPSLLVNADGTAKWRVVTDRLSVADLLAGSGTALIVHAGPDNFANIPARYAPAPDATTLATGDAGARIACGLIQAADPAN
jgi:Cu-Zn family superoxide dismutase